MNAPSAEEELVREFLSARDNEDYEAAIALVTEDCVWHSPINGPERGRNAVREMLEAADRDTTWFRSDVYGVEQRGARVLAQVRNRAERHGEELDSLQALAFTVRDGAISEVKIFVDDPEQVEAFWNA